MPLGILVLLRNYEPIISALGFFVAIAAIFLLFYVERVRRPNLKFLDYDDRVANDNVRDGFMWHHLKVQNSCPLLHLNRDAALSSMASVEFIREGTRVPQITAHWTNQPEPRTLLLTGTTLCLIHRRFQNA
ncbi:MAG TPA: hypothetical protein VJZ32_00715 [Candidatus Bathyarchaeia archaeon]|nr:hypothetical protein [Candidatus Bathyarchaeia archaeon]